MNTQGRASSEPSVPSGRAGVNIMPRGTTPGNNRTLGVSRSAGNVCTHPSNHAAAPPSRVCTTIPSSQTYEPATQTISVVTQQPMTAPRDVTLNVGGCRGGMIPDLLHAHVPPPYPAMRHRHRRSDHPAIVVDEDDKGCCGCCVVCIACVTTFRWVLVCLALLGVACVITGIILAALHMTVGSSFLTLSLMFIGLGVMLVVVVGVGWRCTPTGHEPCHILFNLGEHAEQRTHHHRSARRYRDRGQWLGGVVYPEFRYRRPPPSYTAAMHDFQQQLMLSQLTVAEGLPNSPPPTYRSHAAQTSHNSMPFGVYPSSGPPTYRSRASGGGGGGRSGGVSTPGSASSTLHRATQRVVSYLDSILGAHSDTDSHARSHSASDSHARSQSSAQPSSVSSTPSGSAHMHASDDSKVDEPQPSDVCADTPL